MSNVHQLVNELAKYEQERKLLEAQLDELEATHESQLEDAEHHGEELGYKLETEFDNKFKALNLQLDTIYDKIDELEREIDNDQAGAFGFYDDY